MSKAGILAHYGIVPLDRVDVRGVAVAVLDLRAETGDPRGIDESTILPPGHAFSLSVYAPTEGESPTAEVRLMIPVGGVMREIRLVGALTHRPGLWEITPDMLKAAIDNPDYLKQLQQWVQAA